MPQFAQPSRKGRKAWRKNIDITDVEEHIEQTVQEEMSGGPAREKADAQLFVVDKGQDSQALKRHGVKRLRIDEILGERSAVRALGKPIVVKKLDARGKVVRQQSVQERKRIQKALAAGPKPKVVKKSVPTAKVLDIWGEETDVLQLPIKPPSTLRERPRAAKHIPAVEVPAPGASYNPSYEDHQEILKAAHEIEIQKIEEKRELDKVAPKKETLLRVQNLDAHLTMDIDLPSEDEEENVDASQESGEHDIAKKAVVEKRKTQTERNREKRIQQEQQDLERRREEKRLLAELEMAKKHQKQLQQAAMEKQAAKEARKQQLQEKLKTRPQQMSRHAYQPVPLAVKLTEELPASLRELKPESNLFQERFNNLQKRNIIETRVPVSARRRYQVKEEEKYSYKHYDRK